MFFFCQIISHAHTISPRDHRETTSSFTTPQRKRLKQCLKQMCVCGNLPFAFIFPCRFKAGAAKECIREILREQLYNPEEQFEKKHLSKTWSDEGFDRYKLIVQVVVGEQHGHTGDVIFNTITIF
uniref:Uncharacterized protein n=1 Tax=Cyprinus carpio carpio TaxID=630221 RepID=A0A9J7Z7D0_CYPCA